MRFPSPLIRATLLRRYKRFLADIRLPNGQEVVAHCPNPGSMMGVSEPNAQIWVEFNEDPKKKLRYGWRLLELPGGEWAGIDTSVPNRVVGEALRSRQIAEIAAYGTIRPEVRYGKNSRIDFLASQDGLPTAYIEVKNVHLRRDSDWAEFPDSVTARGAKHLAELSDVVRAGHRAVMLYLIQRTDCARFKIAPDLDPAFARAFGAAHKAGVEMLAYDTDISPEGISIRHALPVQTSLSPSGNT